MWRGNFGQKWVKAHQAPHSVTKTSDLFAFNDKTDINKKDCHKHRVHSELCDCCWRQFFRNQNIGKIWSHIFRMEFHTFVAKSRIEIQFLAHRLERCSIWFLFCIANKHEIYDLIFFLRRPFSVLLRNGLIETLLAHFFCGIKILFAE